MTETTYTEAVYAHRQTKEIIKVEIYQTIIVDLRKIWSESRNT